MDVRIESQLADRFAALCDTMTLLPGMAFDCDAVRAGLSRARVPLPEPGETYLLPGECLDAALRQRLDAFLGLPPAAAARGGGGGRRAPRAPMLRLLRHAPFTAVLLAALGVGFLAETVMGGSVDPRVLVALGANVAPLDGQYWRLVASLFLHIGLLHLVVNAWALYQLGALFELWLGSLWLAVVFFVSGICGSLASVVFTLGPAADHTVSAGASGAIFGILGALIAFLARRRDRLTSAAKSLLLQLLFWAGLNVFLGLTVAAIDNSAHMGGFAAGLVLGIFLQPHPRHRPPRAAARLLPPAPRLARPDSPRRTDWS